MIITIDTFIAFLVSPHNKTLLEMIRDYFLLSKRMNEFMDL
jgi:hypothetical protein